jgi:hypothetical protein
VAVAAQPIQAVLVVLAVAVQADPGQQVATAQPTLAAVVAVDQTTMRAAPVAPV